ncbi:MAG: 3-deoxy-8-phosphooctulonate synthase [Planctomycetes bacterium]|nr:3-deoxy-8-phosphooctulonate synthase [Planctomycetota bacterium]
MNVSSVNVGELKLGGGGPLFLIAGPCVIESDDVLRRVADAMMLMTERLGVPYVFKASFDKANRSSAGSYRGVAMDEGLAALAAIRDKYGCPILSDIHESDQAAPAAAVLDCLQIPAFLCRQTDLLLAAAATGKAVNVKKGQFLAPWDMKNVVEKIAGASPCGKARLMLTERGTSFGYNRLVSDMTAIPTMREYGYPVIFDATHSVQQPGGLGNASGGNRAMVPTLARAAVAAGCDGLFLEVHPDPDKALSDGPNMLPLSQVQPLLEDLLAICAALKQA